MNGIDVVNKNTEKRAKAHARSRGVGHEALLCDTFASPLVSYVCICGKTFDPPSLNEEICIVHARPEPCSTCAAAIARL